MGFLMEYVVPKMELIPQDKEMSCWYASAMMLIHWHRRVNMMCAAAHPDPSQVKRWGKLYDDNPGITNDVIIDFARDLGLKYVPPMSPTVAYLEKLLRYHGPLWTNGKSHITVVAGIRDTTGKVELLVYDPDRPEKKHGDWRGLSSWYVNDGHSGRDAGADVQTVFLHLP